MSDRPINAGSRDRWTALEPYAQLFRTLMPRLDGIAVFDARGQLRWSGDATVSPDLSFLVEQVLPEADAPGAGDGVLRVLGGQPVYICWLRDEWQRLVAAVAMLLRGGEGEARPFSFVHSLLKPALDCMRGQLLTGAELETLGATVDELDDHLALMLSDPGEDGAAAEDDDELKRFMTRSLHLGHCQLAMLIVPERSIALVRTAAGLRVDSQTAARAHRYLLQLAAGARGPVLVERLDQVLPGNRPWQVLACPVRSGDGKGQGVLALFHEPGARRPGIREARVVQALSRRAADIVARQYDTLTGLLTRCEFEIRARAVLGSRPLPGLTWSVLYVNCDRMHALIETHGPHVGDAIVAQLGGLIRGRLPPRSLAAHLSGDRFAVLLPLDAEDASRFAETLCSDARQAGLPQDGVLLHVTVSIGVAPLDPGRESGLQHALLTAETASKGARERGGDRVIALEPGEQSLTRRMADLQLAEQVREALATNRLRLDTQLIRPCRPADGLPDRYELLVRMVGGDGAVAAPGSFLPATARFQMLPAIDRWVLQHTLQLLQGHAVTLNRQAPVFSINISGPSLADDEYVEFLFAALGRSGLEPRLFCFEITEPTTIVNMARAENVIRRLRRLGCGVALDDFGTGLCSLSYLRQLPVSMLKIDGTYVRDVLRDPRADRMVQVVAQLAHGLGLQTVAEFVESDAIRERIEALGIDYVQGFALAQPEPFEKVLARLADVAASASSAA